MQARIPRLESNGIEDAQVVPLAEALQLNTSLTELRLPNFPNLASFIAPLAVALQRNGGCSVLRTLVLGESAIGSSGVTALSNLLRGATALEQLHFSASHLSVADVAALAPAIGTSSLTHLDLSNNSSLDDAALAALTPGLCACPGLRKLNWRSCILDSASASAANLAMARIVQQCRALERLELCGDMIGHDGVSAMFAALHSGAALRSLLFSDTDIDIGTRGLAALVGALDRGWNPTHLGLTVDPTCGINESVLALAAALERHGPALRLEWLRLWVSDLSVDAAVALVRAAHRIPAMRSLDLCGDFSRDDHAALSAVRAACSERPDVAVYLLQRSDDAESDTDAAEVQ